ncbi:MAG TPA: response regulator [Terracidiphilus sp.]|nr:response regulator [Terracidiphilus sp.]
MMPRRLLFVDDEQMVLDGLRRALHSMRLEWEMTFVDTGAAALAELERGTYDAVITDMRMPGMDGAQLLEEVKRHQADVVRVVLSGQTSKEALIRSIDPTHQFLSKPCDINELKLRLSLAFEMRDLLLNPALKSVVTRMRSIPSLPSLFNELTAALRSENTSLSQIESIIAKDPAMAAKTLQLANSAFIGARGQVSSLLQAVSLIGTETIRALALSVQVFLQIDHNPTAALELPPLWDHSVDVALLARHIARLQSQSEAMEEQCFTVGLLHDVGKAVLLSELPREYRYIVDHREKEPGALLALEAQFLGCTHAQIGAYLMSIWGLPAPLVVAVALHHRPAEDRNTSFSPLTAAHCADAVVAVSDPYPLNHDGVLDAAYVERMGLNEQEPLWRRFHEERILARSEGAAHGR